MRCGSNATRFTTAGNASCFKGFSDFCTSKNSALRKGVLRQPMRCGEQKSRFYKEKQWVVLCVAEIF